MFTYDHLRWLMEQGILTFSAGYDSQKAAPKLIITMDLPEPVMAVIEEHKDDLFIEIREADGAKVE